MRCCVRGCKNDSRHISKLQGITFHVIPNDPKLRTAWLKALGKEKWEPKDRSAVCSEHFLSDDLYKTQRGLRKVRAGAVPVIYQQEHLGDMDYQGYEDPVSLKVCRICLATDRKLYPMEKHNLEQAFENVTGLAFIQDSLPQQLCVECIQRLRNCNNFRDKTHHSNSVLLELMRQDELTPTRIKAMALPQQLSIKHNLIDHYDDYVTYSEPTERDNNMKSETEEKDTNEVFIQEDFADSTQDLEYLNLYYKEDQEHPEKATEHFDDNHTPDIKNEGFSSDDSLPLEFSKKKKKAERKKKTVEQPIKIDRRRRPFLNGDLNQTLFTIIDLTYEEQIAEIHKRKDSSNYKKGVFKCQACFKGFLDEDAYNSHMSRHTNQCGDFECEVCKIHFKHQHALRKHITAHHTQRFSCNQCPYVTSHRQTARLHERWHKGTQYQCPHCSQVFFKFTTYMGHLRIKHPSDFVCELCGNSFVSKKGIELHKKLKHRLNDTEIPVDGPYCELCNVRFVSPEAHARHISVSARHDSSEKNSKELNKSSKTRRSREAATGEGSDGEDKRRYPSQMRKAEGPIPCEQCGLQLEDSRAYHAHFRRMHPDKNRTKYPSMKSPCMCEICGRIFQSGALLKDHTWTHTGERPFKCDRCGKCFRMRQRLVAHRRVHSAAREAYVCPLCGKRLSTHSNRQRHMIIHTGLKPFKCEMCGKCFKHASDKRGHINYVHLKKPWPKRTRGKKRDNKAGPQPQQMVAGASEMDAVQPIWPACDPKIAEMNAMMEEKPIYYNLKI